MFVENPKELCKNAKVKDILSNHLKQNHHLSSASVKKGATEKFEAKVFCWVVPSCGDARWVPGG